MTASAWRGDTFNIKPCFFSQIQLRTRSHKDPARRQHLGPAVDMGGPCPQAPPRPASSPLALYAQARAQAPSWPPHSLILQVLLASLCASKPVTKGWGACPEESTA